MKFYYFFTLSILYWILHSMCVYFIVKSKRVVVEKKKYNLSTNILVVIPARNEETNLYEAIRAINAVEYPTNMYSIVVLADKCIDRTSLIAKKENVIVIETLKNDSNSKGGVLSSFFIDYKKLISSYDCVTIIDADTRIDKNFFRILNEEMNLGHKIVQGKARVINSNSSISTFMVVLQSIINIFFYKYHSIQNKPVIISGKGVGFSTDIINNLNWSVNSLIEDVDLSFKVLLMGIKIHYREELMFEFYQPQRLEEMWNQQRRWISGQYQIMKKYLLYFNNEKIKGGAQSFLRIGLANSLIPVATAILLITENYYTVICIFIIYYVTALFTAILVLKLELISVRFILCKVIKFPLVLLYFYAICFTCLIIPRKKWFGEPFIRNFIANMHINS